MKKTVADYIIQELIYAPTETMRATLVDPSVHELFCRECGHEFQNGHSRGCDMEAVEEFMASHEHTIQQYARGTEMNNMDISNYIGSTATILEPKLARQKERLQIRVRILDTRIMIGRPEAQVTPTDGSGERWVLISSLIDIQPAEYGSPS